MQQIIDSVMSFVDEYIDIPKFGISDAVEIVIIAFLVYNIMIWVKRTRAWTLFKGIVVLFLFVLLAAVFNLNTISWLANKTLSVGVIAMFIVFQPELRNALEQLGRKKIFSGLFSFEDNKNEGEKYSDKTINELVKASFELAKTKTGALIVIEKEISLAEYVRTGIGIDAIVTSQLLINIFEHNTPLHDGAVILSGDRIVAATCYLPLSDSMEISKELGTRHRAGLGISEVSDSVTIIVSEETGRVSLSCEGRLYRNIDGETLKSKLVESQNKPVDTKRFKIWKGRNNNEKTVNK